MFRISFNEHPTGTTIRIEGRFAGHYVEEARQSLTNRPSHTSVIVDLSDVTFADTGGEETLNWLKQAGATFVAQSLYALHLCESLNLPIADLPEERGEFAAD